LLTEALQHVGARSAAELDINDNWTRFILYAPGTDGAPVQATGTLLPDMVQTKAGYVSRPSERDFFYVVERSASFSGNVDLTPPSSGAR
jgi:hypothetical protein